MCGSYFVTIAGAAAILFCCSIGVTRGRAWKGTDGFGVTNGVRFLCTTGFGVAIGFGMTKGADVERCVTEVKTVAAAFARSCVEMYGPTITWCSSVGVVAAMRDPIAVRALPATEGVNGAKDGRMRVLRA